LGRDVKLIAPHTYHVMMALDVKSNAISLGHIVGVLIHVRNEILQAVKEERCNVQRCKDIDGIVLARRQN
jgi:hypothetical protein